MFIVLDWSPTTLGVSVQSAVDQVLGHERPNVATEQDRLNPR